MNEALVRFARELALEAPAQERLRLAFGHACAERVQHLLVDDVVRACLDGLGAYLAGALARERLDALAADAAARARSHPGSESLDGAGHAAVSASHAVAQALAGRALGAADYAAYAMVYGSGGHGAVADAASFEPEWRWQLETLTRLAAPQRAAVLVSACLIGRPVRYDGAHKRSGDAVLQRWLDEGRVVAVCPEIAGGLGVPRLPAEIAGGAGGAAVLAGRAQVIDRQGHDVSAAFVAGAQQALREAQARGIRVAVLKEGSPSCGSGRIHDGSFSAAMVPGQGVTAALLESAGIRVFSEAQFAAADACLHGLEARPLR